MATVAGTSGNDVLQGVDDYVIIGWEYINIGGGYVRVPIYEQGNDTFWGYDGHDTMYALDGFGSYDDMFGGNGNDRMYGYDGIDYIYGEAGADILDGGADKDAMFGGPGDDFYYVDRSNDIVTENFNEGYDMVYSTASFTLTDNVEFLEVKGNASYANGNNIANKLVGNGLANTMNGYDGNDSIYGGNGSDTISGGNGNDFIVPGDATDYLTGGAGADKFRFDAASHSLSGNGRDLIYDFNPSQGDKIDLSVIDADLTLSGNQAFTVGSYVSGILTGVVIGGSTIEIGIVGAPSLVLGVDLIL